MQLLNDTSKKITSDIPKPVWAVGFALEQTLHVVAITVFSFLILNGFSIKRYYVIVYSGCCES
ncbi:MAG: hypothetical protein LBH59_09860 [Planctomycetaceae bacterium]|nr:hypothetical protein [Planctomycetaceae bacterium]